MAQTWINIHGGVGKNFAFTALLSKLKQKYGEVVIVSPYQQTFIGNPNIKAVVHPEERGLYDRIPRDANIMFREPYVSPFIFAKTHLLYEWARLFDITYDGELPEFFSNPKMDAEAAAIRQNLPEKFVIFQFAGGQSPYNLDKTPIWQPGGQRRAYPLNMAQRFIHLFKKKYPDIGVCLYQMKNEEYAHLKGGVLLNAAWWYYPLILRSSLGFIAIDSSLHHMAAAARVEGVVIWGATGPQHFGYKYQVNISNTSNHHMRPLQSCFGDVQNADGSRWVDSDILSTAVPEEELLAAFEPIITLREEKKKKAKENIQTEMVYRGIHDCECGGNCKVPVDVKKNAPAEEEKAKEEVNNA